MQVQTRSEMTGLRYFDSLKEAIAYAKEDETVWKVSFSLGDERVILDRLQTQTTEWLLRANWGARGTRFFEGRGLTL